MNAENDSDQVVKVYRRDTNAPGKDTRSSGTDTTGYGKIPETLNENSNFPDRIDNTAHVQDERVSTGTNAKNAEFSALTEQKNNRTSAAIYDLKKGVIQWGDREYDVEEFRLLVQKKDRAVMGEDDNGTR
jgi:hypothetical protein